MDTEFSGFSVPLEHSFEVGEKMSLLFYDYLLCNAFLSMLAAKLTELSCANSDNDTRMENPTRQTSLSLGVSIHSCVWFNRSVDLQNILFTL